MKHPLRLAIAATLALAGCQAPAPTPVRPAGAAAAAAPAPAAVRPALPGTPAVDANLLPLPAGRTAAFVETNGAGDLAVTASFEKLTDADFANSAARYHLASMAAGKALLTLSTLDENLLTKAGVPLDGATNALGAFTFVDNVPTDRPFVVNAHFVRGHRMSALARAGQTTVAVNEGSSMVAEMARWQLAPFARPNDPDLADLTAFDLGNLTTATAALLPVVELASSGGAAPGVDALKAGAGHVLRNLYVAAFGGRVTAAGASTPPEANRLSDLWEHLLGFKPLALTRAAGNGIRDFNQGDGNDAAAASLLGPADAVANAAGDLYVAEAEGHLIRFVPKVGRAGPFLGEGDGALAAGKIYTIAGVVNGPKVATDFDTQYATDSAAVPEGAPAVAGGYAVFNPTHLVLEDVGAGTHLYFTSPIGGRVCMIPAAPITHFGRNLLAGRLYTIAGSGAFVEGQDTAVADGAAADAGKLAKPQGLARDAAGNLWILDAGGGTIRVVREADGKIFTLPMLMTGNPFTAPGALDLRLSPAGTHLYVADTARHAVFRVALPTAPVLAAAVDADNGLPATAIERVLGNPGKAGFMDTDLVVDATPTPVKFPDIHDVSDGVDEVLAAGPDAGKVQVLLNAPSSLDFDAAGDLIVGDAGNKRLRLLRGGKAYTIAGGLDTRFLGGDARLAFLPGTASVRFCAADGNVLVTDRTENLVRRLHTARGTLVKP